MLGRDNEKFKFEYKWNGTEMDEITLLLFCWKPVYK